MSTVSVFCARCFTTAARAAWKGGEREGVTLLYTSRKLTRECPFVQCHQDQHQYQGFGINHVAGDGPSTRHVLVASCK